MAQKFTVPITVKQLTSASSDAVTVFVDADTFARLKVEAGGRLVWGSGSGAGDTNLYRASADVLQTDDTFKTPVLFVDNIEIDPTGATTNQILQFNGTKFVAATVSTGGGATNLDGLTDVVITTPEEFQGLSYNGTNWVNSHIPLVSYVRNVESTTITTGTCVYLFGATGDHATVKRADNNTDATSSKTIGIAGANITASNNGPIVTRGYVDGIDLSVGYTAGDVLWLGENGAFTKTKPTAPDHLVFIGVVVRATSNGIIYVATQNGYELDELHNVSVPSPISGDFLKYDGTLWVNDQINLGTDTVGNYVQNLVAGTGITLTNGTASEGGTPTVAVTANTYQPLDGDLTAIAGLAGTSGVLKKTAADTWALDTSTFVTTSDTGSVTSTMIANGTIVDADINASAGIALSKLATSTAGNIIVYNASGVPTSVAETGDITISDTGVTAIASGVIVNADINASAAIDKTKISGTAITAGDTGTVTSTMIADGTIVNGDINASAAIAHSKLANATAGQVLLGTTTTGVVTATTVTGDVTITGAGVTAIGSGVIVNADVSASAGIELSKLATSTAGNIIVYNASGVPTAVAETGDVTISDTGVTAIATGVIVNADISSTAAIAYSKLANATPGQVLIGTTTTGVVTATTLTGDVTVTGGGVTAIGSGVIVDADINSAAAIALSKLSTTGASTGNVITYNGSTWAAASVASGGASVTISDTPPASPTAGNLWFESDTTKTYIRYNSAWVEVGSIPTIQYLNDIGDVQAATPITGQVLQWNGTYWVPAIAAGGGLNTTTDGAIITMAIGA